MSCLGVNITRVGGVKAELEGMGGIACTLGPTPSGSVALARKGGLEAALARKGGVSVTLTQVCEIFIRPPYLYIEPTVMWIPDWGAYNDVYSNTHWNIY